VGEGARRAAEGWGFKEKSFYINKYLHPKLEADSIVQCDNKLSSAV